MHERSVVIVGDSGIGKTALHAYMVHGRFFPIQFPRLIYNRRTIEKTVGGKEVQMTLLESLGGEAFDGFRTFNYPGAALVIICFDVSDLNSFRSVKERWIPEVLHFGSSPRFPILLVGCKADLRGVGSGQGQSNALSVEQGYALAISIGALKYLECSALTGEGVSDVSQAAAEIAFSWDPKPWYSREDGCRIM